MTSEAALNKFFSSFGIPAFVNTDNSDKPLPCLTYETPQAYFDDGSVSCAVNLWYNTDGEAEINAKAREIADRITRSGTLIEIDDGYIWLRRGVPFSQALYDSTNTSIKRRYILINLEYLR